MVSGDNACWSSGCFAAGVHIDSDAYIPRKYSYFRAFTDTSYTYNNELVCFTGFQFTMTAIKTQSVLWKEPGQIRTRKRTGKVNDHR